MSETVTDADRRRQELEAELARIAEAEKQQKAEEQARKQAELEAQLDPEMLEQKKQIEQRAKDQLDREFPPTWNPQKPDAGHPDQIIGLVLNINPRVGPSPTFGTYSAVVEVRTTSGVEWTVWCNEHGALYAQLTRLRVQPGEVIAIRYKGMKDSTQNPGQTYHDFKLVRVDDDAGPPPPVDYDALSRGPEPPELGPGGAEPAPAAAGPTDDIPF